MNSTVRYASNDELPSSIREQLSPAQQTAYRHAYNDAWGIYSRDNETNTHGQNAETRAQVAHEAAMKAAGAK